ncbi:MAG: SSU ribosomal protein S14p (S29e) @ SSU ribosomal protein S14p (S29e), zinc-independent, partial [uncultured Craurococcus sp.]
GQDFGSREEQASGEALVDACCQARGAEGYRHGSHPAGRGPVRCDLEARPAAAQRRQGARAPALRADRPPARQLSQVQAEPEHAAGARQYRPASRRDQGQLV